MKKEDNEFYIGWMPAAPGSFVRQVRKTVAVLLLGMLLIVALLATQQKKFSTASFEFGQLTEIKGIYRQHPVPSLKIMIAPGSFLTIPLIGYGKFGAESVIGALEKENNTKLDGKIVTMKGALLYSDGKTLLQIDANDRPLVRLDNSSPGKEWEPVITELGDVRITGEVLDPKCYFGAMKPGHGKPHRDCAVRCMAGGIPPVFYVRDERGAVNYYLLLGTNGGKINEELKNYIAEPIYLEAKAVRYDDWVVLYTDTRSIRRTGGLSWFKTDELSCRPSGYK